jgi:hypothetical protein
MWWRLALLGMVSTAIAFVVLTPTTTMMVHLDLPPSPSGAPAPIDGQAMNHGASAVVAVVGGVAFVLYVAVVLWIGRWIVRRYGAAR